jgi:hypothetical protein
MFRRSALALVVATPLLLNGSMALATMSATPSCDDAAVCALSLRMMAPPPPRPADLRVRHDRAALPALIRSVAN